MSDTNDLHTARCQAIFTKAEVAKIMREKFSNLFDHGGHCFKILEKLASGEEDIEYVVTEIQNKIQKIGFEQ